MLRNVDFARRRDVLPPLTRKSLLHGNMGQWRSAAVQVAPKRRLAIDFQSLFRFFHNPLPFQGIATPRKNIAYYTIFGDLAQVRREMRREMQAIKIRAKPWLRVDSFL